MSTAMGVNHLAAQHPAPVKPSDETVAPADCLTPALWEALSQSHYLSCSHVPDAELPCEILDGPSYFQPLSPGGGLLGSSR